jgi:hypothetical protein
MFVTTGGGGQAVNTLPTSAIPIQLYDASLGMSRAIMDPSAAGNTYEFVGPYCYRMDNLLHYMYAKARCIPMLGFKIKLHGWRYEPMHWIQNKFCNTISRIYRLTMPINYEWIEFCVSTLPARLWPISACMGFSVLRSGSLK